MLPQDLAHRAPPSPPQIPTDLLVPVFDLDQEEPDLRIAAQQSADSLAVAVEARIWTALGDVRTVRH
ncbi:hypothetical protein GCM10009756_16220 [Pseudokineococcus marinus]